MDRETTKETGKKMDKNQYINFTSNLNQVIKGSDLSNQTPRTLLYGYTQERATHHVYLDDSGKIVKVVYDTSPTELQESATEDNIDDNYKFVPNKRLYPEACDLEFCRLLIAKEVHLPFTTHAESEDFFDFYGYTLEQLTP